MDRRRIEALLERLGDESTRREGLKAALAVLFGAGVATAGVQREAEAGRNRRRRKRCDPACPTGQTCVNRTCTCDNGGLRCGDMCCTGGQTCQSGACVDPLPQCLAFGAACKDVGVPCCDGVVCASGQGGKGDVACWKPAGAACATTAECVYDSECKDGVCVANQRPTPSPACEGSFPVTGDPAENGRLLKEAIAAAADGDTILLAAGEYAPEYDDANGQGFVTISKPLTLMACSADAVVTILCPGGPRDPNNPNLRTNCIRIQSTDVVIDGIDLVSDDLDLGVRYGVGRGNNIFMFTFRNGSISGMREYGLQPKYAQFLATLGPGVAIDCPKGKLTAAVTCEGPVTWGPAVVERCDPNPSLPATCNC